MRQSDAELVKSWRESILSMKHVLGVLDETGAPADIGAHIDLGICKLEQALSEKLVRVASPGETQGESCDL